jgi:hypothetical protein
MGIKYRHTDNENLKSTNQSNVMVPICKLWNYMNVYDDYADNTIMKDTKVPQRIWIIGTILGQSTKRGRQLLENREINKPKAQIYQREEIWWGEEKLSSLVGNFRSSQYQMGDNHTEDKHKTAAQKPGGNSDWDRVGWRLVGKPMRSTGKNILLCWRNVNSVGKIQKHYRGNNTLQGTESTNLA